MIEALVSLRRNGETDLKKNGYIIQVKLAGSPWGSKEKTIHQVIEWEDAELEAELEAMREAGEPHPVISLPYNVSLVSDGEEDECVSFGSQIVDLAALEDDDINNPNADAGILAWENIEPIVSDKLDDIINGLQGRNLRGMVKAQSDTPIVVSGRRRGQKRGTYGDNK